MPALQTLQPPPHFRFGERHHALLAGLTLCTLLIHGYHPFAEDGGLYVAGVLFRLNSSLFPHDSPFVSAHLAYSMFSTVVAGLVRISHLPLPWVLFLVYLACTWTTLYAAWQIAIRLFPSERAAFFAVSLLAASFTMPVAGTSLSLMDPYVTARTFSTPLSLLSISFLLVPSDRLGRRSYVPALTCLVAAAAFHPLMASYAAGQVVALLVARFKNTRNQALGWLTLALCATAVAAVVQVSGKPESAAAIAADISRYYWFPSQWQWFELLGLAGPCLVLALALRACNKRRMLAATTLCRAGIGLGLICGFVAILFAQQHFHSHAVARLQPLRAFLVIYAVMVVTGGGLLADYTTRHRTRIVRFASEALFLCVSALMFCVQRQTFPASQHLELPWRVPANPWSEAFAWAREHTAADALFALDANYITQAGEDAQAFRATAQRSMLADFSKDGGEAAITPSLAGTWITQSTAQKDLSLLSDEARDARLRPFGVTWMVLLSSAETLHDCPYDNRVVKVCISSPPRRQAPPQP